MLVEEAFTTLPEILLGSGYQKQDYEAGLVGAFSLSLLQALNARNVANPISCMMHEKLFRKGGVFLEGGDPRYLRADLFLNLSKLWVGSKVLSQYGWRHDVWLEAKFFRKQAGEDGTKHSSNKSNHAGSVIADLIRLCALVEESNERSRSGRYFLHCYDANPDRYLAFRNRSWLRSVVEPGRRTVIIPSLQAEKPTIRNNVGDLGDLSLKIEVTNSVIEPITQNHRPVYYCVLTRIDGFEVREGGRFCALRADRSVEERQVLSEIASFVAERLHIKPFEEQAPEEQEDVGQDEVDVEEAP